MKENAREVLAAVLSHDGKALGEGCISPRLRAAAIAYRNATTKNAADALKNMVIPPDLDALNAAVAEAVEKYAAEYPAASDLLRPQTPLWVPVIYALNARREALKPKARYTVCDGTRILDRKDGYCLTPQTVADLLNKEATP